MSGATDPRGGSARHDTQISGVRQRVRDESADVRIVESEAPAPAPNETDYRSLFEHMNEGAAYGRVLYDAGKPVDFAFLAANRAFERLTGFDADHHQIQGIRQRGFNLLLASFNQVTENKAWEYIARKYADTRVQ